MSFTPTARFDASSFSIFSRSMMQDGQLPLVEALADERFAKAFEEHGAQFAADEDAVYTPAITLCGDRRDQAAGSIGPSHVLQ